MLNIYPNGRWCVSCQVLHGLHLYLDLFNILMNIQRKDISNTSCNSADDSIYGYSLKTNHLQFCEGHGKIKLIARKMQVKWENVNGYS